MSQQPAAKQQSPAPAGDDAPPFRYGASLAGQIEGKWQDRWERERTFQAPNPGEAEFDPARPKKYILDMFPYPSGVGLHVGHPLGYIATDIFARYLRMTGHNVLHTIGFDAFGLPAEEYARETGTHPRITTERNIATMRSQLKRLGLAHDGRRSISTIDPGYYKWTQWIFLKIYNSWYDGGEATERPSDGATNGRARPIGELVRNLEAGTIATRSGKPWTALSADEQREEIDSRRLAYLADVTVNWCPKLGTVLANEEVTAEGRSERGDHPVYKRPLKQWMMRITSYAERLAADLDLVDWPESVRLMQRNWIGRSEGAWIDFPAPGTSIRVFTTRPDTVFGATYMVLSPEHPLVDKLAAAAWPAGTNAAWKGRFPGAPATGPGTPRDAVAAYRRYAESKSDVQRTEAKEKTGVFIGAYATNPATGKPIPIFIADYVLMGYGTGAIMAVPGQDERDWEFAEQHNVPIIRTVQPPPDWKGKAYAGDGPATNSGFLDGLNVADAKKRIAQWLKETGRGEPTVTYKLRDWLFSRQRYWGEPFPIVFDDRGIAHDLPESMLPVLLPDLADFTPTSSDDPDAPPTPPLGRAKDWVTVELDLGGGKKKYRRETNTMPNWAGSCWYYLRYLDPANESAFCDPAVEQYWMAGGAKAAKQQSSNATNASTPPGGVDLYVGGVEHAVLHLLYARFWHKVLYDLGYVSTPEPFRKLFNQGYIQAAAYRDPRGAYVEASEVEESAGQFMHKGKPVTREFGKMGKSLKNAVTPDDICREYGCDTLRVYEMSMGPLEASKPWNTRDIVGAYRFLQRIWRHLIDEKTGRSRVADTEPDAESLRLLHKTIKGVRQDFERLAFNTPVSKLIVLNDHLGSLAAIPKAVARDMILMLAPYAPHLAEELWERCGLGSGSLAYQPFPISDDRLAADDVIELPVSINGKVRGHIRVAPDADQKAIEAAALAEPKVQEQVAGKTVKKVIVVPKRMVNVVVG
jgi:leucyl-tRNA synthetase